MRISMTEFCTIKNNSHNHVSVGVSDDEKDKDLPALTENI